MVFKKRLQKWKCTVCKHLEEAYEKPLTCKDCGAERHKLKTVTYTIRRKSHADEPEAYD